MRALIYALAIVAGMVTAPVGAMELANSDVIGVETHCAADSVTVGERFVVTATFTYPDSLTMLPVTGFKAGKNRAMSMHWHEGSSNGRRTRTARMEFISLDLAEAKLPSQAFDFETPSGDTLRALTDEIVIPVRSLTADSQEPRPLKEQWVAPRDWMPWIIGGAAALLAAAIAFLIWWRRSRRLPEPEVVPSLPPDYIALTELTRIEKLGLVDKAEFKQYYTLVVDAVRRYIEARFDVEAMDRTSFELLADLRGRSVELEGLEPLLGEADLVKFAKHVPQRAEAENVLRAAREIVVKSAPKHVPAEESENVADGTGGSA